MYDIGRLRAHARSEKQGSGAETCHQPQQILVNCIKKYILSVIILQNLKSMDRRLIILIPSCFSRQDPSNGTHNDPNETASQSDPGHGQGHYITMDFIMCGVTPPKWAVLPVYYQFSEKLLYNVAL